MNISELNKILAEHKVWVESCGEQGSKANLRGANLRGADLPDLTFIIMGMEYSITITNGEYLQAGCQNHKIEEWRQFSKRDIAEMDGRRALKFYPRLLDVIDFYISKGPRPDRLNKPELEGSNK